MSRRYSVRTLARRLFQTPQSSQRPSLSMLNLEDRTVPAFVDVGGLRFEIPGNFTTSNPVLNETLYQTTEAVKVGLTPTGGNPFVPVAQFSDGAGITDRSAANLASRFSVVNRIEAITNTGTQLLQNGGFTNQNIDAMLENSPGVGGVLAAGTNFALDQFNAKANSFRFLNSGKLGIGATFDSGVFGGFDMKAGSRDVSFSPSAATSLFSGNPIEAAFDISPTGTSFNVGGLSFKGTGNKNAPTVGGVVRYTPGTKTFEIASQAEFTLKGNQVSISTGAYGGGITFSPGVVIVNGSVQKFDLKVTGEVKLGGLTFSAKALQGTYEAVGSTFTLKGGTGFAFKGNTVDIEFGSNGTPGLVISNGSVVSADFGVTSQIKVGKLDFSTKDLRFTYTDANSTFTMTGNAKVAIVSNFVDVNFGEDQTAGLVIENGSLKSLNFAVNSEMKIGGLQIKTNDLRATYDDPTSTFTLAGKASFQVKGATINITLGTADTKGIVVTNGQLTNVDATVDSTFQFSSVTFTTKNLRFTYEAAGSRYTITGEASVTFKIKGNNNNLDVKFGQGDAPGLIIENGALKELTMAVNANFNALGLQIAVDKLNIHYNADRNEFGMFGAVRLSTQGSPGNRVLDNFSVKLGQGSFDAPGIRIVNGSLDKLDIELNGKLKIAKINVESQKLRVRYDSATSILQFTGGLKVSLVGKFNADVALTNGGLTINTDTGKVNLNGVRFRLSDVKVGKFGINKLFIEFQDGPNGVNVRGEGEVTLPGNITVGGSFAVIDGKLDAIGIDFQKDNPGVNLYAGVVYLTRVKGEVTGLSNLDNFTFNGTVELTIGPKVSFAGGSYSLAKITGNVFINREQLTVSGEVKMLEGKMGTSSGEVSLFFTGDTLASVKARNIPVFGVFRGDLDFSVGRNGDTTIRGKVSVKVPDSVPLVGGKDLAAVELHLQIRPSQPTENSFAQARLLFGPKPPDVNAASIGDFTDDLARAVAQSSAIERVKSADLNGDGKQEMITWTATGTLSIYDGATQAEIFKSQPFGEAYKGDLRITLGDLTRDGVMDLVITAADRGSPRVRVLNGTTRATVADFLGIDDTKFRGGAYTAVGDINADGVNDLVVTAGAGGGPRVAGYNGKTLTQAKPEKLFNDFFAFDSYVRSGAIALVRDLDGDGFGDLLLGSPDSRVQVKALSGVDLMTNTIRTVSANIEATIQAMETSGVTTATATTDAEAQFFGALKRKLQEAARAIAEAARRVAEAARRAAEEVKRKAEEAARAIREAAEKAIDLAQRAISFTAAIKVRFNGQITGIVKSGLGAEKSFSVNIPGLGGNSVDGVFSEEMLTALAEPEIITDGAAYDIDSTAYPTVKILSVASVRGAPQGVVEFETTSPFPDNTFVDIFVDTTAQSYNGRAVLTRIPVTGGVQRVEIPDLSAFASQPYDENDPVFVYAMIDDSRTEPVYSDETMPVIPENFAPSLKAGFDLNAPLGLRGNRLGFPRVLPILAIDVVDPLAAANPAAQVQLELHSDNGNFVLGPNRPSGLQIEGDGGTRVVVIGTAADITTALDNLTYTQPNNQFVLNDEFKITLARYPQNDAGDIAVQPIRIVRTDLEVDAGPGGNDIGQDASATSIAYVQGSGPQAVLPEVTLNSQATAWLTGAKVSIIGYEAGRDFLALPETPDITGMFDVRDGTLTLVGVADVEQYEAVLRSLTFSTTSAQPKTLSFVLRDDEGSQAPATVAINVLPSNPSPTIGNFGSLQYVIDSGAVVIAPELALVNPDGGLITGATVQFPAGEYVFGQDVLSGPTLGAITSSFDSVSGILTLSGDATVQDYQAALRSVTYSTTLASPEFTALTITVSDASGSGSATMAVAVVTEPASFAPASFTLGSDTVTAAGNAPVALGLGSTLFSPDVTHLVGAKVAIAGGFVPGEDLLFIEETPFGITATFDDATGVLTLTGAASVEDYGYALGAVQYLNRSSDRTPGGRVVTFAADTGYSSSAGDFLVLNVVAAPMVETNNAVLDYEHGGEANPIAGDLTVTNRSGLLTAATVAFVGDFAPEDALEFAGTDAISGEYDSESGILYLSGTATAEQYQAALRSVMFRSNETNPEAFNRVVMFTVSNGTQASGESGLATINVAPEHVTPTIAIPAGLVSVGERAAPVAVAPALTITASDPDEATLEGASVVIENYYIAGDDVLGYGTLPAGVDASVDEETGVITFTGTATIAEYQALLRSVTYANVSPSPLQLNGGLPVTFFISDGFTEESSATAFVKVTPANDPPVRVGEYSPIVFAHLNGGPQSLGLEDINFTPPAGMTSLVITVTETPDAGTAGLIVLADGSTAEVGDSITLTQLRGAKFLPSLHAFVGDGGTFKFTVAGVDPNANLADSTVLTESIRISVPEVSDVLGGLPVFSGSAGNGQVSLFDNAGVKSTTIDAFTETAGVRSAVADFNKDGTLDIVAATSPGVKTEVKVIDGKSGATLFAIAPYGDTYKGGAFVAAGDVTGDGVADFAITPDQRGGARARVFNGKTMTQIADFFAINDPKFRGGARPAIGDMNGDGVGDLVVSAGAGGGPRITAFDGTTLGSSAIEKVFGDFFAFEPKLRNGAFVAVGDVNGDGIADLVAGAGPGGGPRVTVFDGLNLLANKQVKLTDFFAGDTNLRGGVRVAVKDLDGDERADLVVGAGSGSSRIVGYKGVRLTTTGTPAESMGLDAFDGATTGVFVG